MQKLVVSLIVICVLLIAILLQCAAPAGAFDSPISPIEFPERPPTARPMPEGGVSPQDTAYTPHYTECAEATLIPETGGVSGEFLMVFGAIIILLVIMVWTVGVFLGGDHD